MSPKKHPKYKAKKFKRPKSELNPVEKWRRKLKEKKYERDYYKKINRKQTEPSKQPIKRSPSPQSNDPLTQKLITPHGLREPKKEHSGVSETPQVPQVPQVLETHQIPEATPQLFTPSMLTPTPVAKKPQLTTQVSESESEEDFYLSVPKPTTQTTNSSQSYFKKLLSTDSKVADFLDQVSDLL